MLASFNHLRRPCGDKNDLAPVRSVDIIHDRCTTVGGNRMGLTLKLDYLAAGAVVAFVCAIIFGLL
jgi:hypothetical protein